MAQPMPIRGWSGFVSVSLVAICNPLFSLLMVYLG
jgi:hypothetical protein